MSAQPTTPTETQFSILQSDNMTATVETESGSRYTIVARPNVGVVLIHDTEGWVRQGRALMVVRGQMLLIDTDRDGDDRAAWRTTRLTHIYIATN